MANVRAWTRQVPQVWDEIQSTGRYRVREEYVRAKNAEISDYYIELYRWLTMMCRDRIAMPDDAEFPICAIKNRSRFYICPLFTWHIEKSKCFCIESNEHLHYL